MGPKLWDDDENLLAELAEALRGAGPSHEEVVQDGRAAWTWRGIDAELELATLMYDSLLEEAAGVRAGGGPSARLVVFEGPALSVELEIGGEDLIGQILPPGPGEVVLLGAGGEAGRVSTDDAGCFTLPLPPGPLRLRCRTADASIVTDWVRL